MIRPVRQLTIKSLLFLMVLWSILSVPFLHVQSIREDVKGRVIGFYIALWTLPVVASLAVRKAKYVSVAAFCILVACWLHSIRSLNPFYGRESWFDVVGPSLFYPLFADHLTPSEAVFGLVVLVIAYVLIGPLFSLTCRLRDDDIG